MPREFADDKKKKPAEAPPAKEDQTPPPVKADEKPPDEKKPATPTAEELAARAEEISASMFPVPGKKTKPPEAKPEDKPKEPDAKEPEAKPPEPEPEKKPAAKKPLPPPISEAVKPESLQAPAAQPEAKPPVTTDLNEDDEETLAALARMERDGKAPRGIVDRTKRFWADEADYIAAWEKANPGAAFDLNDEAHAEFYDKNEPRYDEQEFKRAAKLNLKEQSKREIKEELKKETEAETYEREMREHVPKNAAAVSTALTEMVADAGFKDLLKDGKLTKEVEAEIDKASPHARAILHEEAQLLAAQISEVDKLERFAGKYQMDPNFSVKVASGAYVQPHRMLADFVQNLEREIAALPPEETARDGKRFVTQEEFMREVDKIRASPAPPAAKSKAFDALSAGYYTIGWEDIRVALISQHSTRARAKIDTFGGIKKSDPVSQPAKTSAAATPAATPETRAAFRPPSVSSASDNTDTTKKAPHQSGKTADDVARSMWG